MKVHREVELPNYLVRVVLILRLCSFRPKTAVLRFLAPTYVHSFNGSWTALSLLPLVVIVLFRYVLRLRCYERKTILKNRRFVRERVSLARNFR